MADAYKIKQDVTLPRAIAKLERTDMDGNPLYEHTGVLYAEGDYVRASDISPALSDGIENGDFDAFLEGVSGDELEAAEASLAGAGYSQFAPEHEVERVALLNYGHDVLSKQQVLDANSAGADAAKATLEAAKEDGADERPAITEVDTFVEVPNLNDGETILGDESETEADFDPETDSIQTMPSGVVGGAVKNLAEGGDPPEADKPKAAPRKKPAPPQDNQSAKQAASGTPKNEA